jgi:hypothetical protein
MNGFNFAGWSWSVAAPAMLWGLLGIAIPIVIHLFNRRRATVVEWGAMQFLEQSQRAQRRITLTEILLMLGRMSVLALVALAVARPLIGPPAGRPAEGASSPARSDPGAPAAEPRDIVLILDGSQSMARRTGESSARKRSVDWARRLLGRLAPGSSAAVLDARERVVPVVVPPSFDVAQVGKSLDGLQVPLGGSDLPAALADALRILESTRNARRDIVILTDGQRFAWRPGETARWDLLRELYRETERRRRIAPRIWAVVLGEDSPAQGAGADGAIDSIELSRNFAPPGLPVGVTASVSNAGPGVLDRTAELLLDGKPVPLALQHVGPIPPGGKTTVSFQAAPDAPGGHLLTVRLTQADDPLPANDEFSRPFEVAEGVPVVLVDGEPGLTGLEGETGFARAALMPAGDSTPAVRATVIPLDQLDREALGDARVVMLANVERLTEPQEAVIAGLLARGGGVLVAPGDRTDLDADNPARAEAGAEWLPARARTPRSDDDTAVEHPAPASFAGSWMARFAEPESAPLPRARFHRHLRLEPLAGASVLAQFGSGDPWIVERGAGRGRVILLAAPLDAEWSTLPVNPDFVPWLHSLVLRLADSAAAAGPLRPGEPIRLDLPTGVPPTVTTASVRTPDGRNMTSRITHHAGSVQLRFESTDEPGIYQVERPTADGSADYTYVSIEQDPRESEPERLEVQEAARLSEGWPLEFLDDRDDAAGRLLARGRGGPKPAWRWLLGLALAGLCLEVAATRALARRRAPAGSEPS